MAERGPQLVRVVGEGQGQAAEDGVAHAQGVGAAREEIVRIYSTSGVLVRVLEHNSSTFGGALDWDVRNRNNQIVASGVYFYHIEAPSGERRVGRMTIVNFAQ